MKLYEYPDEIDRILAESEDGELTPEMEAALDAVLVGFREKVDGVLAVIDKIHAMSCRCHEQRTRLASRQSSFDRQVHSLKTYLLRTMAAAGESKIVTPHFTVSRVTNSRPSIRWEWTDRDIPEPYRRIKTIVELDGNAAFNAYRRGELPEGFAVELGESLRIR